MGRLVRLHASRIPPSSAPCCNACRICSSVARVSVNAGCNHDPGMVPTFGGTLTHAPSSYTAFEGASRVCVWGSTGTWSTTIFRRHSPSSSDVGCPDDTVAATPRVVTYLRVHPAAHCHPTYDLQRCSGRSMGCVRLFTTVGLLQLVNRGCTAVPRCTRGDDGQVMLWMREACVSHVLGARW